MAHTSICSHYLDPWSVLGYELSLVFPSVYWFWIISWNRHRTHSCSPFIVGIATVQTGSCIQDRFLQSSGPSHELMSKGNLAQHVASNLNNIKPDLLRLFWCSSTYHPFVLHTLRKLIVYTYKLPKRHAIQICSIHIIVLKITCTASCCYRRSTTDSLPNSESGWTLHKNSGSFAQISSKTSMAFLTSSLASSLLIWPHRLLRDQYKLQLNNQITMT